uniref:Plasmid partition protein A n=1 Tax=Klebsiella pneumoniae TaxID=573 RepID=A0A2P1BPA5_KLEPN|nr:Plasmid partition protein A [Klebsiella pneumoniae]
MYTPSCTINVLYIENIMENRMKRDYGGVGSIARRAGILLESMSRDIEDQRKEFNLTEYFQTFTRNAVAKLPKLSRRIVEQAIKEMEDAGYDFNKKRVGNVEQYALQYRMLLIFTPTARSRSIVKSINRLTLFSSLT